MSNSYSIRGVYEVKMRQLSIIIPAYNAEDWLVPTCEKIVLAAEQVISLDYEIIIVNDGSSDKTKTVAEKLMENDPEHIITISHKNTGRYLTRKRGVEAAKYSRILFIDTRVWVDEGTLEFLYDQLTTHSERLVWNGHINVAKKGNIIARFGDAITQIGWRRYFSKPRTTSYGLDEFDHYPKGTGLFCAPKTVLQEAFVWFEANTSDIKNSSDDTLLIRHIAETNRVWISPEFSATYFARTTFSSFVKHSYHRGVFFVDGFLRPGTRFYYPLLAFLIGTVGLIILCILIPEAIVWVTFCALFVWVTELVASLFLGLKLKDGLALFVLTPVFAVVYGLGIWRAVIKKIGKI